MTGVPAMSLYNSPSSTPCPPPTVTTLPSPFACAGFMYVWGKAQVGKLKQAAFCRAAHIHNPHARAARPPCEGGAAAPSQLCTTRQRCPHGDHGRQPCPTNTLSCASSDRAGIADAGRLTRGTPKSAPPWLARRRRQTKPPMTSTSTAAQPTAVPPIIGAAELDDPPLSPGAASTSPAAGSTFAASSSTAAAAAAAEPPVLRL